MRQPGLHRGLMSKVAREVQYAHLRMRGSQLIEQFGGGVGRAVVDEDDFLASAGGAYDIVDAVEQFSQHARLVVDGQHDADRDVRQIRTVHVR